MEILDFKNDLYETSSKKIPLFAKISPSFIFYYKFFKIVLKSYHKVRHLKHDTNEWVKDSLKVLRALENVGIELKISGINNFKNLTTPCVFIGNHMSTLETLILPAIIQPIKDVTFVVKKSLLQYPFFKHVLRSFDPIAVGRKNPREDYKAVLEGGILRLKEGKSIVVFPQATRRIIFEPKEFNTIGIKLANRANVPVVPIALKTDAWKSGKYLKDFGKINPSKKVYFAFGEPLWIKGRGVDEHQKVIEFIKYKLIEWIASS